MALYKDILEEKMRKFEDLKEKEESSLKTLESLPIHGKALDKAEKVRAQLEDLFESCYEDLYNEDHRLRESAKPETLGEQPKPIETPIEDEHKENKMGIVCPTCGTDDHEPGASYCHICGATLGGGAPKKEERDTEEQNEGEKDKENAAFTRDNEGSLIDGKGQYLLDFNDEDKKEAKNTEEQDEQ